jgi:hypothetical protein
LFHFLHVGAVELPVFATQIVVFDRETFEWNVDMKVRVENRVFK